MTCTVYTAVRIHLIINCKPHHIAPKFENPQSSTACHPIASLHSLLPSIWFLSETKSSFLLSCLCSIISLVPQRHSTLCFKTKCCFCCFQVVKPCHVLSCESGATEYSALIEANSCNGALMSSWIFLCTINYWRAIMYQGLVSNCRFQVLIKIAVETVENTLEIRAHGYT